MGENIMNNDTVTAYGIYGLSRLENRIINFAHSMPSHESLSWFGKYMANVAKRAFLFAHAHPIVDTEIDGLKLRLYLGDNSIERKFFFTPQFFEVAEREYLKQAMPQGGIFVDIGANAGIHSLTACQYIGHFGKILAVDKDMTVLQRLKYNAALNNFEDIIITENVAVTDKTTSGKETSMLDLLKKYNLKKIDALRVSIEGGEDKVLMSFLQQAEGDILPQFIIIGNNHKSWQEDLVYALQKAGYDRLKTSAKNSQIWLLNVLPPDELPQQ